MLRAFATTSRRGAASSSRRCFHSASRPQQQPRHFSCVQQRQLQQRYTPQTLEHATTPFNRHQKRQMSFFDELKKSFNEELAKNKELQEASDKVQQQLSQVGKTVEEKASKTVVSAKEAASKSAKAAQEAASKSQDKLKSASEGQEKNVNKVLSETSETVSKKAKQLSNLAAEKTAGLKDNISGLFGGAKQTVEQQVQEAQQKLSKGIKSVQSTEEFKNLEEELKKASKKASETIKTSAGGDAAEGTTSNTPGIVGVMRDSFKQSLGETSWADEFKALFKPEKKVKKIKLAGIADQEKKKMHKASTVDDAAAPYDGPSELLTVDQPKSGWEAFSERLSSTPLISRLLKESADANMKFQETETGKTIKGTVDATRDFRDELRERWETSQNPWVYRLSGWHDTFFSETETATAVREVQRLDPEFDVEEFLQALEEETLPHVVQSFVEGNNDNLRHVLSEGAYAQTYAAMKARVAEGHVMDPNVLHLEEPTLLLAQTMEKAPPVFLVRSIAHQVNCIRNRDGEVTEGSPSEIRTVIYMMAFQQEVDDELNELAWKIVEFGVHPLEARFI